MAGSTQGTQGGGGVPSWWREYFHDEPFDVSDRRAELVTAMIHFFSGPGLEIMRIRLNENASEELVRVLPSASPLSRLWLKAALMHLLRCSLLTTRR